MSVMEDVQAGLKTKQGKVVAVVVGGGLAYLWWTKGRQPAPAAADPGAVTTTDRVPGAAGGGGGQTGTASDRPTDNETWLQRAVSVLTNPPYNMDAAAVYDALRRALDGLSITVAQQAIVSKAIGLIGSPPGGMPPLNSTDPGTGSTGGGGGTNPVVKYADVRKGWHVDQWITDYKRQYDPAFSWEVLSSLNPQVSSNINWVNPSSSRTFKADATYRVK